MRTGWVVVALVLMTSVTARAEWQIRPFIGFTFGSATSFVDPENAIDNENVVIGVSGGWLGEIFGFEADVGRAAGFFQTEEAPEPLVLESAVTTLTGNAIVALPRRMAGYGLRPYFAGGAGLMHVDLLGRSGAIRTNRTLPVLSLGGGVTGFISNRVGLNWDVRRLSTFKREGETLGNSLGEEHLSLWRATMAVALRY
ncbi:MAG: hypothetical protein EHM55_03805 [Acidobacteria bacterium]|nr:MAG: hypothetical protein EHM55_03805 [Acidobacteriota bacterium]